MVHRLFITNRTIKRAQQLADVYHARAIRMGEIPVQLENVDVVISATSSQLPLIGKWAVESALLHHRKRRPIFMADLALPRDIEPEVAELEDVYIYNNNIDDLQSVITQNWQNRETAAKQAEAMVEMQAVHYIRQLRVLKAGSYDPPVS